MSEFRNCCSKSWASGRVWTAEIKRKLWCVWVRVHFPGKKSQSLNQISPWQRLRAIVIVWLILSHKETDGPGEGGTGTVYKAPSAWQSLEVRRDSACLGHLRSWPFACLTFDPWWLFPHRASPVSVYRMAISRMPWRPWVPNGGKPTWAPPFEQNLF